ncbi:MAG: carbonic anhydrase [Bacteroidetes bacterium]|nr:MAG: carbonic anhydrase [Bacteroidota bacterium]
MEKLYQKLLQGNKDWVAKKLKEDPEFFKELAAGQQPGVLWIGCSDSRVPANEITGTKSGEVFVHRNIANMVVHTDTNMLSVLDFAVNLLEVQHVIVCGHYGCGGIQAAMSNKHYGGIIDNWLRNIKDVYRLHNKELDGIKTSDMRDRKLTELNIVEQVYNLCKTSIVQSAWENHKRPHVHGWVYDVSNGLIKDLNITVRDDSEMHNIYKIDF